MYVGKSAPVRKTHSVCPDLPKMYEKNGRKVDAAGDLSQAKIKFSLGNQAYQLNLLTPVVP